MKFLNWLIGLLVTWVAALAGRTMHVRIRARFFIASKTHRGPQRIGGRLYIPYRGALRAVPAGGDGTTTTLDVIQKDIADVGTFMREKYEPLKQTSDVMGEEMGRLKETVSEVLELQRQANRAALFGRDGPQRIRYVSVTGLSEHMVDRFDLMILRKFLGRTRAEAIDQADPEKLAAADRWAENLDTVTRALDSTTAGGGLELVRLESLPAESLSLSAVGTETEKSVFDGSVDQLYRHGFVLELRGGYEATLRYLRAVEEQPWQLFWDELHFEVLEYPQARVEIELHTLGQREGWIGV